MKLASVSRSHVRPPHGKAAPRSGSIVYAVRRHSTDGFATDAGAAPCYGGVAARQLNGCLHIGPLTRHGHPGRTSADENGPQDKTATALRCVKRRSADRLCLRGRPASD